MSAYDFYDDADSAAWTASRQSMATGQRKVPTAGHKQAAKKDTKFKAVFSNAYGGKSLADYYEDVRIKKPSPGGDDAGSPRAGEFREGSADTFAGVASPELTVQTPDLSHLATVVGYDNEVAKLLRGLYGRPKPVSAPPKPRTSSWSAPSSWQRPMHTDTSEDPRDTHINRAAIELLEATRPPAVPVKEVHVAAIETVKGHRKTAAQIEAEKTAAAATSDIQLPPLRRGYNTEAEKRKLQAVFAYKGGRTLPEVAMPEAVEGHLSIQMMTGKRRLNRNFSVRTATDIGAAHGLNSQEQRLLAAASKDELRLLSECHATTEELLDTITESRQYIAEMSALGALDADKKASIEYDIIAKQNELGHVRQLVADTRRAIMARMPAQVEASAPSYPTIDVERFVAAEPRAPIAERGSTLQRSGQRSLSFSGGWEDMGAYPQGPRIVRHDAGPAAGSSSTAARRSDTECKSTRRIEPSPLRSPPRR